MEELGLGRRETVCDVNGETFRGVVSSDYEALS